MTNTDTEVEVLDRETGGEPMASRPTRRDLAERGLDVLDLKKTNDVKVSAVAGGVSFATALEVIEFAKLMAVSGKAVPKHLRANPGGCLAIAFQAVGWRMDPFQVANKSYEVNDRIGFESQLIHAVVEARAPLQHRLDCKYAGELIYDEIERKDDETGEKYKTRVLNWRKSTRSCTVIGQFVTGDVREYETPMICDIRTRNSPLWKDDPDQQLFYYASRSWARKWCPDVLMGIYSREELASDPALGREEDGATAGLHARLIGSTPAEEGHRPGHVESELDQVAPNGRTVASEAQGKGVSQPTPSPSKRASELPKASPKRSEAQKTKKPAVSAAKAPKGGKPSKPAKATAKGEIAKTETIDVIDVKTVKDVDSYLAYARSWIVNCQDSTELFARWTAEKKLRNAVGVTADDRLPIDELIAERREELEK